MSHEIRTPMNAIIGMADLLAATRLSQEQRNYVEVFKNAGENLLILIEDILDLSKIEADKLILNDESFDLESLLNQQIDLLAMRALKKGLELILHIDPYCCGMQSKPGQPYQLLVLDSQMADGDRLDLLATLAYEPGYAQLPVVLLSSGERRCYEQAEAAGGRIVCLPKPIKRRTLWSYTNSAWIFCRSAALARDNRGLKAAPTAVFTALAAPVETGNRHYQKH